MDDPCDSACVCSHRCLRRQACTYAAAVEIGGGPWDEDWLVTAEMKEPLRSAVQLPVDVGSLTSFLPPQWRPPGL